MLRPKPNMPATGPEFGGEISVVRPLLSNKGDEWVDPGLELRSGPSPMDARLKLLLALETNPLPAPVVETAPGKQLLPMLTRTACELKSLRKLTTCCSIIPKAYELLYPEDS